MHDQSLTSPKEDLSKTMSVSPITIIYGASQQNQREQKLKEWLQAVLKREELENQLLLPHPLEFKNKYHDIRLTEIETAQAVKQLLQEPHIGSPVFLSEEKNMDLQHHLSTKKEAIEIMNAEIPPQHRIIPVMKHPNGALDEILSKLSDLTNKKQDEQETKLNNLADNQPHRYTNYYRTTT